MGDMKNVYIRDKSCFVGFFLAVSGENVKEEVEYGM